MRTLFTACATAVLVGSALSGCSSDGSGGAAASPATNSPSSAPASPASSPPASASVQPAPSSGTSNEQTYTVTPSSEGGKTPDGKGTWKLNTQTVSGGDPKVADAFNSAVKAAAQEQLDTTKKDADPDPGRTWDFETTPRISFSSGSVSELITGLFYAEHAAHPVNVVSTVVIDSRTAKPITLKDLFVDEQKGLQRLSEQTKLLLPGVMDSTTTPMPDEPGNAPTAENFANWIPTPDGLEINFEDYQFAHGLIVLTVPWSALDDVLAPGMDALRKP